MRGQVCLTLKVVRQTFELLTSAMDHFVKSEKTMFSGSVDPSLVLSRSQVNSHILVLNPKDCITPFIKPQENLEIMI